LGSVKQWIEGGIKSKVDEDGEDEECDHEDQGTDSGGNGEEADETELGKIHACEQLFKGARVNQPFGVDLDFGHEEDVVTAHQKRQSSAGQGSS